MTSALNAVETTVGGQGQSGTDGGSERKGRDYDRVTKCQRKEENSRFCTFQQQENLFQSVAFKAE